MLGKLIKNEFKSTAHSLIPVYSALAISVSLTAISLITKNDIMGALSSIILAIIGFALIIVTFVCIVLNFNKSLYGSQGYLSLTLPVKSSRLLGSKTIVSFFWMLMSFVIMIGIFIGIYLYIKMMAVEQYGDETISTIKDFVKLYADLPGWGTFINILILFLTSVFADLLLVIMYIYFALSAANTRKFQKASIVWAIVFFFAGRIIIGDVIIKNLCRAVPIFAVANSQGLNFVTQSIGETNFFNVNITEAFLEIIAIVGLFIATNYLIKSKVNVK
jgi:hypothetical protein